MTVELKRDFSGIVLDLYGKPVQQGVNTQSLQAALDVALAHVPAEKHEDVKKAIGIILGEPLTYGAVLAHALTEPSGNEPLPPGEAPKRVALAMRIVNGGEVVITPDERDKMKQCVQAAYRGAIVPGRAVDMLEGAVSGAGNSAP